MSQLDKLTENIPAEIRDKLILHFGIAKEYAVNPDTIPVTFYTLMYVVGETIRLQTNKKFTGQLMDYLEGMRKNYPDNPLIQSMRVGQLAIEELINNLSNEANQSLRQDQMRSDQLNLLMRKYFTIVGLVDILSVFGPIQDKFVALAESCKSQAFTIFRNLETRKTSPTRRTNVPQQIIRQTQTLFKDVHIALENGDANHARKSCEQILQLLHPYRC